MSTAISIGSYRIIERIAVGGMSEVFKVRHIETDEVFALKSLLADVDDFDAARKRFAQEAELGRLVSHPNIVRLVSSHVDAEPPHLIFEYVAGCDLHGLIRHLQRDSSELSPNAVAYLGCEFLRGLVSLHETVDDLGNPLGVVHRDVSPTNVLLSEEGDVKIADLGIALCLARADDANDSRRSKGKLGYIAPEQVRGDHQDQRVDIFSAAVVITEVYFREKVFDRDSELAVLLAIRDADLEALTTRQHIVPNEVMPILRAGLAANPDERIADAKTLLAAYAAATKFDSASDYVIAEAKAEIAHFVQRVVQSPDREPAKERISVPVTADVKHVLYDIQKADGSILLGLTYARVTEAIATGEFGPKDLVRQQSETFRAIRDDQEYARHLPMREAVSASEQARVFRTTDSVLLHRVPFSGVLARSALARQTGMWLCEHNAIRKEVYLVEGVPKFVTSTDPSELLGEQLVAHNVITREELDMALAVLPNFGGKLGDTIIELGLSEPLELFQHISEHVRGRILDLFLWTAGTATLYLGVPAPSTRFPLALDPWNLLKEGTEIRLAQGLEDAYECKAIRYKLRRPISDRALKRYPTEIANLCRALADGPHEPEALSEHFANQTAGRAALLWLAHSGVIEGIG